MHTFCIVYTASYFVNLLQQLCKKEIYSAPKKLQIIDHHISFYYYYYCYQLSDLINNFLPRCVVFTNLGAVFFKFAV